MMEVGSVAVLGDGTPWTQLQEWHFIDGPERQPCQNCSERTKALSWKGGLAGNWRLYHDAITSSHRLFLNHYVTRARKPFVDRKVGNAARGGAGEIGNFFLRIYAGMRNLPDAVKWDRVRAALDRFEHEQRLDEEHAICKEGSKIRRRMLVAQ